VKCDYCKIAEGQTYRWGPADISKQALFDQLARRFEKVKSWSGIESVQVSRRNEAGRMAEVLVTGSGGEEMVLRGEIFRLAVGSRTMRSTDCTLIDDGPAVRFTEGRGFGHGVGLCQWGAEGQARAGRYAGQILAFYFPGARLVRAY
jgi:stage II sporulation protein D